MILCSLMLGGGSFAANAADFAFGADLSFLQQAEARGKVFKDGTNALPGLQIFKNHGYNWIRLRIFVEPVGGGLPNDLKYTLAEAQDAKKGIYIHHYTTGNSRKQAENQWVKQSGGGQ
jgi:arabinogalactan endo-1,4-beta-galactosidase